MPKHSEPQVRRGILIAVTIALSLAVWFRLTRTASNVEKGVTPGEFMTNALQTLEDFEYGEAAKYWAPELVAQKYGAVIENFWDALNSSSNAFALLPQIADEIRLPVCSHCESLPHGIQIFPASKPARVLRPAEWGEYLDTIRTSGWRLVQCEFRHIAFVPAAGENQARSTFYFSAHLQNDRHPARAILEGNLKVVWSGALENPGIDSIDASELELRTRAGADAFQQVFSTEVQPFEGSWYIDPLIVWDLDHDGVPEIILAARNLVFRRSASGSWQSSALCQEDPRLIFGGVLGDFDGNGTVDFLSVKFEGVFLFPGTIDGRFVEPSRQVWSAQPHLKFAEAITPGDVDGDGDLDLFLGQYKVPYDRGQMPHPYFDANDGYPSFLLLNDGRGNFRDGTQSAGLGAKRGRRVYSASLVDLDADGDLDLVVSSDFAGLDAYENDGHGRFTDVTTNWFGETHAFGMGHTLADFNNDGRPDLFLVGMNSPTCDRLASLGLNRPYDISDTGMRARVTYGNRLFYGSAHAFAPPSCAGTLARTGWSWGAAAGDLDNDGWPDLYITNGHETRESVREYEPRFWLHDIYVGNSQENALAQGWFRQEFLATRAKGASYGGYEKNRLFLSRGGTNFIECAFLFGLGLQTDSRNVLLEDLNGDGKLDLVLTTFEVWPKLRQTLQIFENHLDLSVQARPFFTTNVAQAGKVLRLNDGPARIFNTTDSFRSQHQLRVYLRSGEASEAELNKAGLTRPMHPKLSNAD